MYILREKLVKSHTKTDSIQIAVQNNTKNDYIKVKIDKTKQNSKFSLRDDRDETINHISECRKLGKYETRQESVGKGIHWELCKKFKFDHIPRWYMHQPESVLKNETPKIICDFEIQTYILIPARRPNLVIVDKKMKKKNGIFRIEDFAVLVSQNWKWKKKKKTTKKETNT